MVQCSAYGCKSRSEKKEAEVTFHRFPLKNPQRTHLWAERIKLANWSPTKNDRLCSKHFEKKLFYRIGDRTCLLDNAVPTIFLELQKYLQPTQQKRMSYIIERIVENVVVGEAPHWDAKTETLYFVCIKSGTIHKYKPSTKEHRQASVGPFPTFIIPLEGSNDKFLISLQRDLIVITWDGFSSTVSNKEKIAECDEVEALRNNRLNDGKVDPTGRLWAGSMNNEDALDSNFKSTGRLFSFNRNRLLKYHLENVQISNGLAWSEDLKKFYYIDSMKKTIDQFDYDVEKEAISNRTSIFTLDKHNINGVPDGQTIDTDGNLWVAIFNGSKVIKIDPRVPETLLQSIDMPAKQVTSVTFGGKNLDELFVTTARHVFVGEAPLTSADGATYRITGLGVKGFPGVPFNLDI